jgi:hypothetical protein
MTTTHDGKRPPPLPPTQVPRPSARPPRSKGPVKAEESPVSVLVRVVPDLPVEEQKALATLAVALAKLRR